MNNENFNDPLEGFDPVMDEAFSVNEEKNENQPNAETTETPIQTQPVEETHTIEEASANQEHEPIEAEEDNYFNAEEPTSHTTENESNTFFDNDESFDIDESLFEETKSDSHGVSVAKIDFSNAQSINESQTYDKNLFKNIKVDVSIELGRSKVSLKKLYELKSGSIIELGRLVGEPLDLVIKDQVIARGEVVAVNSNYGIRITHIESLANLT
tara:strand:+ start:42 stop:680 length:639 start_codon:yes stop_codon:yes gene_type:complete